MTRLGPVAKQKRETTAEYDAGMKQALTNTVVIIPALNEQESIGRVLADLPSVGLVVVVDNGSTDATPEIARQTGAVVVDEPVPGYGRACLAGIRYVELNADKQPVSLDYVAFLDGDYSDYPEQIVDLLMPVHNGEADFVLGSRLMGLRERGAMPPQSVYGNKLAVGLIRLFWGHRYTDLGPFRVIHRDALRELGMQDENFGWTVEMQIKAVVRRLRIMELPVDYRCRVGKSKISGTVSGTIRAGCKILLTIAKYRMKS